MPYGIASTTITPPIADQTPTSPTFTGPFASGQVVAVVLKQIGKLIILEVPGVAAAPAASATATATAAIPAAYRPSASVYGPVIITSNAVILPAPGRYEVDTSGNIKISADLLGTLAWLNIGNNGWSRFTVSWTIA